MKNRRNGISFIELLVVISITGILATLAVMAVQAAREAARRAQCTNNLRQIGISINNFASNFDSFPRGGNGFSAFCQLLPYMDLEDVYNSINFDIPLPLADPAVNRTSLGIQLGVFLCPSDSISTANYGPSNYGGNYGFGFGTDGVNRNGPFSSSIIDKVIKIANVRDGLSNTVAVSEFCRNHNAEERHKKRSVFNIGTYSGNQFEEFISKCRNLDTRTARTSLAVPKGWCWAIDGHGSTLYNHNLKPNEFTCNNGNNLPMGAWTASSYHSGGVNALFLDGHVNFIKDSVAERSWRAVGTVAGEELDSTSR